MILIKSDLFDWVGINNIERVYFFKANTKLRISTGYPNAIILNEILKSSDRIVKHIYFTHLTRNLFNFKTL